MFPKIIILWLSSCLLACCACFSWQLHAQDKPAEAPKPAVQQPEAPKHKYVRLTHDMQKKPLALETVIVSCSPQTPGDKPLQVDLIGAVHVGDKAYYDALNTQFQQYDALLYELVAPKNTKIPKDRPAGPTSAIGAMQVGMKEVLELEFQLDCVDYTKANFVHADMTPEEFSKSMNSRGESFMKMYFRAMGHGMANQKAPDKSPEINLLFSLFSKNRAQRMKIVMAEQFNDMESQINAIEGPEGSTILGERNKKALEVLDREIKAGKQKIGIFYGAAHLPDMESRMLEQFKLKRDSEKWLTAWDLTEKPAEPKK